MRSRPDAENYGWESFQELSSAQRRGTWVTSRVRPLRGSTSEIVVVKKSGRRRAYASMPFLPGNDASATGTADADQSTAAATTNNACDRVLIHSRLRLRLGGCRED